jgi:predicted dehydrogenase
LIDRVLIVGLGSAGHRHLKIARDLIPNADIRVYRHQTSSEIPKLANGLFIDIQEAINFSPHLAVISSPAPFHISIAQALVEKGTHLLVEKPLSHSASGVKHFLDLCKNTNIVLLVGYNLRFFESLQFFRKSIKEGVIGKVISFRCEVGQHLPSWRPDRNYRESVSAQKKLGGGCLLELSHELDYINWIFGEIEWVSGIVSNQSTLDVDVEDTAHVTLGLKSFEDGFQLIGVVNLDFIRQDSTRYCLAIGEKGTLRWDGITGDVMLFEKSKKIWDLLLACQDEANKSYILEWKYLLNCIWEKKQNFNSGEDGLKVLEIIDAVRESSLNEKKIFLKNKQAYLEK